MIRRILLFLLVCAAIFSSVPGLSGEVEINGYRFTLPDGFTIELVGTSPLVDRPITADFDEQGRLWMCGRKGHRVHAETGTMYTIPCEAVFNTHPHVFRTALVGVGKNGAAEPVLCVEVEGRGKEVWEVNNPQDIARVEAIWGAK